MRKLNLFLLSLLAAGFITSCDKDDDDGNGNGNGPDGTSEQQENFQSKFEEWNNQVADPEFGSSNLIPGADLGETHDLSSDPFFENVDYKGAVDPNASQPWYAGWTALEKVLNGNETTPAIDEPSVSKTITDDDVAGNTTTLSNDTTYILDGFVFVEEGNTLIIEEGTVIKGKNEPEATDDPTSALIVARGGRIEANGTRQNPITFTYEGDPLDGSTPVTRDGQWGGVLLLGSSPLNSQPPVTQVEGIPTSESRGEYGGNNPSHDAGVFKYVTIRHGGNSIGAGNEIQGLTLAGVGDQTEVHHVEVAGNIDDGFEWFGGTVNCHHIVITYVGDDSYDYDESFRGKNQFMIAYQDKRSGEADRGGEHDGGTDPETGQPYATPTFANCTYIGNPETRTLTFRDNAGGFYYNSIFKDFGLGVDIEYLQGQEQDSYKQMQDGNLELGNNVFYNIQEGDDPADLFKVTTQ